MDDSLLPTNNAKTAVDCDLISGSLAPAKGTLNTGISLASLTKAIYLYNRESNGGNGFWFQFDEEGVSVVPSPIVDDAYGRVYIAGSNGSPRFTVASIATSAAPYPSATYDLGIPSPSGAPTVQGATGEPPEGGQSLSVSYVMTFVSQFGEEGAPGYASTDVDRWDGGGDTSLSNLEVPSGNFVIATKRIYRRELQGVYQLIAEIPSAQTTFTDNVQSINLGEPLESETWLPPNSNMKALIPLPNGGMMGWWENNIAFSEPYRPWAWPLEYRHALNADVVGAAVSDVGIVVVTKSKPYLFTGSDPNSIQEQKLDSVLPCSSSRSVVDMGSYVVYASPDGIVGPGGVISASHMKVEQWKVFDPSSIHAYRWRDRYLAFYDNGVEQGSFTFHPDEGFVFYSIYAPYGWYDDQTGDIYLIDNGALYLWHQGTEINYTWESAEFLNRLFQIPGCARIQATNYPVTFSYYTDGVLSKTLSVQNARAFRLPNTRHSDSWFIQVQGTNSVKAIHVASSMSELA